MPRLEEKLRKVSEGASDRIPSDALETMARHTDELESSGRAEEAVGEGDQAPDFSLPSTEGGEVALSDLLARGPAVLNFYRGRW